MSGWRASEASSVFGEIGRQRERYRERTENRHKVRQTRERQSMRKGERDSERDRDRWKGRELETVRTETRADTHGGDKRRDRDMH